MEREKISSSEVDLLFSIWNDTVRRKKLPVKVKGKRARTLLRKLLERYSFKDILLVFDAIPPRQQIELFLLLSPEKFNYFLQLRNSPRFLSEKVEVSFTSAFIGVIDTYFVPKAQELATHSLTYADILLELPLGDVAAKWWFVADKVFNLLNRFRLLKKKKLLLYRNALYPLYKQRKRRREAENAYEVIMSMEEYAPLRRYRDESLLAVKEELMQKGYSIEEGKS